MQAGEFHTHCTWESLITHLHTLREATRSVLGTSKASHQMATHFAARSGASPKHSAAPAPAADPMLVQRVPESATET